MNNPLGNKLYYSISEVAEITDLQPYTLRAWEREFPCLRPRRNRGKNRAYRERDIGIILLIKQLLYDERYTTQGVKKKLKNEPDLLRQVGTQIPSLLEQSKNKDQVPVTSPPAISTEGNKGGGKGADKAEFRAVVEEAKKELREILELL